eukprot:gene6563-13277_t
MNDPNFISPYILQQSGALQIPSHEVQQHQQILQFQAQVAGEFNTNNKRKNEQDMDAKSKKRFVWPEALHKDFVAAVFDVGLRSASPKTIIDMLPRSDLLTTEHIKSHLQKFRVHRERSREEFLTHYEMSIQTGRLSLNPNITMPRQTSNSKNITNNTNENCARYSDLNNNSDIDSNENKDASKVATAMLRRQFDLVSSTIGVQTSFLETLKMSIINQTKVKVDLAQKIVQLDPTISIDTLVDDSNNNNSQIESISIYNNIINKSNNNQCMTTTSSSSSSIYNNNNNNYQHQLQHQHSLIGTTSSANSAALLMASEMQSLKHVHSFLHKRKKSQMAPFISSSTASATTSSTDSNLNFLHIHNISSSKDENIDDDHDFHSVDMDDMELFDFLMDSNPSHYTTDNTDNNNDYQSD